MSETKNKTHKLKCWEEEFFEISQGHKLWEWRKDDRDFNHGDILILEEFIESDQEYTGAIIIAKVPYILYGPDFGIPKGYCIMSLEIMK